MKQDEALAEKIELLSLDLFETLHDEINIIEKFQKFFDASMGWHYYLDLAWIIKEIRALPKGALLLDAGAGSGLLQFILSELGYNIISADFIDRSFSSKFMERYGRVIHYLNNQKQFFNNRYTRHLNSVYHCPKVSKISKLLNIFKSKEKIEDAIDLINKTRFKPQENTPAQLLKGDADGKCGRIFLYKCDLKNMPLLPDGFVDGVVSVSSLEHNDHEDFEMCMREMLRVTKSHGKLFITVSASQSEDWFHEPSKGWCYSEAVIKRLFGLREDVKSNFLQKNLIFTAIKKEGNKLHERLDPFYYQSGDNGMPWGKWDPQYQPVGILKIKD